MYEIAGKLCDKWRVREVRAYDFSRGYRPEHEYVKAACLAIADCLDCFFISEEFNNLAEDARGEIEDKEYDIKDYSETDEEYRSIMADIKAAEKEHAAYLDAAGRFYESSNNAVRGFDLHCGRGGVWGRIDVAAGVEVVFVSDMPALSIKGDDGAVIFFGPIPPIACLEQGLIDRAGSCAWDRW